MDELYGNRPWLRTYSAWVPHDLEISDDTALKDFIASAATRADAPAVYYFDHAMSYGEIDELSNCLAAAFHEFGLRKRDRIALVLSDVVMPEMDGQALFQRLREIKAGVRMVMMTGHPLDKKLEDLKDKDLNGWLRKPPSLADLAQTISQALAEEAFNG